MKPSARSTYARLIAVTCLSLALLAVPPAFAAEASGDAEMSRAVATGLNDVLELMDAGDFEAAAAAIQALRGDLEAGMTDYEKRVMLQTSANLNTTLARYPEAIVDYEALLQLPDLPESDRIGAANMAGQLHLQVRDWNKALEHLLAVNALQDGNNMETLFRIAFAYSQLAQPAAAVPYMEQALVLGGAQPPEDYLRNMALLYVQTQNSAKAIATYQRLLELYPGISDREKIRANMAALANTR